MKKEQSYIWELLYGWSLQKFADDENVEKEEVKFIPESVSKVNFVEQLTETALQEANLTFLSKNQAVIEQSNNIFWINPVLSDK